MIGKSSDGMRANRNISPKPTAACDNKTLRRLAGKENVNNPAAPWEGVHGQAVIKQTAPMTTAKSAQMKVNNSLNQSAQVWPR